MPNYLSQLVLPVDNAGTVSNVTFDLKDAGARALIEDIGRALYWIGVTTTALTDGDTTNPITVNGESVTAKLGGMASYSGSEFVWNGSAWQEMGKNNFGALAFKSSCEEDYTPAGSVASNNDATTDTVNSITAVGTLPSANFTVSGEVATFNWSAGTLPTKGADQTVLTDVGTFAFTGTQTTIVCE